VANDRLTDGARLFALRERLGLSQREIAGEFGVTPGAIAHWETGLRRIPGPALRLLDLYEQGVGTGRLARGTAFPVVGLTRHARNALASLAWFALRGLAGGAEQDSVRARIASYAARGYASSLGELKGLAMKFGQMIAAIDFALPEHEQRVLAALTVPPARLPPGLVAEIVRTELGSAPRHLFSEWNVEPSACGSVGQVHEARDRRGRRLAVKVQYPEIESAIRTDLGGLRNVERFLGLLCPSQLPGVLYHTMAEHFLAECDYEHEAHSLRELGAMWAHDSTLRCPEVIYELSSRRVLTMTWCDGADLFTFARRASLSERSAAARAIWKFYWGSLLRAGQFNTDPNPGNLVFDRERVVFLDFGRVQRVSARYLATLRALVRAVLERDRTRFAQLVVEIGSVPDPDHFDFEFGYRAMLHYYRTSLTIEPVAVDRAYITDLWRISSTGNRNLRTINLTADMAFLGQVAFGVSALVARLGAPISTRDLMLDALYAPGEPRPEPFTSHELAELAV
jgi:predicted unusual protein kinase regulating ubiquinone biosynthesis (AarF/ABC1/UbiB family)